jgi:hypothetical protein
MVGPELKLELADTVLSALVTPDVAQKTAPKISIVAAAIAKLLCLRMGNLPRISADSNLWKGIEPREAIL